MAVPTDVLDRGAFVGMSTAETSAHYAEHGFVLLPAVIAPPAVAQILTEMSELKSARSDWQGAYDYQGLAYVSTQAIPKLTVMYRYSLTRLRVATGHTVPGRLRQLAAHLGREAHRAPDDRQCRLAALRRGREVLQGNSANTAASSIGNIEKMSNLTLFLKTQRCSLMPAQGVFVHGPRRPERQGLHRDYDPLGQVSNFLTLSGIFQCS